MPHNQKTGSMTFIPQDNQGAVGKPEIWINDLQRPVHASLGDLNGDGKVDMVIASFGHYVGELAWYSDIESPQRKKHILRPLPGAIKSVISDINHDGLPDVLTLMAQGDEGFFVFINQGKRLISRTNSYAISTYLWINLFRMDRYGSGWDGRYSICQWR